MLLLEPFIRIRFGYIANQRIGHLIINTEMFFRYNEVHGWPKRTVFIFTTWDPANHQMLRMYQRRLFIIESRVLSQFYFACRSILLKTRFDATPLWPHVDNRRAKIAAFNQAPPTVAFTPEEVDKGRALLKSMGIGDDDWYVCIHARDSNYFHNWRPQHSAHWASSTLRNNDIATYGEVALDIADKGGFAVRLGYMPETPMETGGNPRIIDYATHHRSDFGDIFLPSRCRFYIGSNSGMLMTAEAFNIPVAIANMTPLCGVAYSEQDLFIPTLFQDINTNEFVPYWELHKLGFFDPGITAKFKDLCERHGVRQINNTAEEIRDLGRDMVDKINGIAVDNRALQAQQYYQDRYHDYFGPKSGIGFIAPSFALKYHHLIIENRS